MGNQKPRSATDTVAEMLNAQVQPGKDDAKIRKYCSYERITLFPATSRRRAMVESETCHGRPDRSVGKSRQVSGDAPPLIPGIPYSIQYKSDVITTKATNTTRKWPGALKTKIE